MVVTAFEVGDISHHLLLGPHHIQKIEKKKKHNHQMYIPTFLLLLYYF